MLVICAAATLATAVSAQVELPDGDGSDGDDAQSAVVGYLSTSYELTERSRLNVVGYYSPELDLTLADVGVSWQTRPWLRFGVSYLRLDAENDFAANYLRASATMDHDLGAWNFELRNILEHRIIENGIDDQTRYRPRFQVTRRFDGTRFAAFAQAEPFFDLTNGDLDRWWWGGGVRARLSENLSLQAEYIRQEQDSDGEDIDALVVGIIVRFD